MPVWQILPTFDGHFQWSASAADSLPDFSSKTETLPATADSLCQFPSMFDLANQAKVIQKEASFMPVWDNRKLVKVKDADGNNESNLVFGETNCPKQFSIGKVTTVVGENAEREVATNREFDGKKAGAFSKLEYRSRKSTKWMQSSSGKASSNFIDNEGIGVASDKTLDEISVAGFPVFETGPGNFFMPLQTSTTKAASTLGLDEANVQCGSALKDGDNNDGFPTFFTGSGKSVTVRQSSVRKAACLLEEDNSKKEFLWPNASSNNSNVPMFKTGSGKSVLVKQSSISKALSVLQDGDIIESDKKCNLIDNQHYTFSDSLFQTSSGKTVNISTTGLSRAAALLGLEGDGEIESSKYSSCTKNQLDRADSSMHNTTYVSDSKCKQLEDQTHKNTVRNFNESETCTSNFDKSSFKFQTAGGKSLSISSDTLNRARSLLGEADQSIVLVEDEKIVDVASWNKENYLSSCLHQNASSNLGCKNQSDSDIKLPDHHSSVLPLVDISNNSGKKYDNMNGFPSKKRPKRRPTVLPFKKPRNSSSGSPLL